MIISEWRKLDAAAYRISDFRKWLSMRYHDDEDLRHRPRPGHYRCARDGLRALLVCDTGDLPNLAVGPISFLTEER
jgi:hypothetical protein